MKTAKESVNYKAVLLTFFLAYAASIVPLSPELSWYRPEWTLLVLMSWCFVIPSYISVGCGWIAGIIQDALRGALLGQNALTFSVVAYFCVHLHQRFRLFPLWQQSLAVLVMVGVAQLVGFWIHGFIGQPILTVRYWFSSFTSMMVWPMVQMLVNLLRVARAQSKA